MVRSVNWSWRNEPITLSPKRGSFMMKWPSMELWSQGKRTFVEALPELRVPCMKLEFCFANGSQRHKSLQTLPKKGLSEQRIACEKNELPWTLPVQMGLSQEGMIGIGIEWPKGRNWKLEIWKFGNLEILEIRNLIFDPKIKIENLEIDWPEGRNLEIWKLEIGNWKLTRNWKLELIDLKLEIENWLTRRSKLEIWKLIDPKVEIGNWLTQRWKLEIWKLKIDPKIQNWKFGNWLTQRSKLEIWKLDWPEGSNIGILEIGWPKGRNW